MAWKGYKPLVLELPPAALVRGWREEARTLFVESGDLPPSGARLALLLSCPPLPHRALVRATVTMVRHAGGRGLPPGYECFVDPRDLPRLARLVSAVAGKRTPYYERRYPRIRGDLAAGYLVGLFAGRGRIRDVSSGGAYLELEPGGYIPKPSSPIDLSVDLPRRLFRRTLKLRGRVAWVDADRGFGIELPVAEETRRLVAAAGGEQVAAAPAGAAST
jgi:hypothetical protein